MTRQVYGIGYSGRMVEDLKCIVEELDAYLVDIRFAPYSCNPAFRKVAFEATFGDRYVYLRAFGNRNYKGGSVEIVDYDAGKVALEALDKPAVLMCVCQDAVTCHRTVILLRLVADGFAAQEWNEHGAQQLSPW